MNKKILTIVISAIIIIGVIGGVNVFLTNLSKDKEISDPIRKDDQIIEDNEGNSNTSIVYMTKNITKESIVEIYNKLGVNLEGNVGVKLSTGEAGGHYYLDPNLIGDLVKLVDGTIVENNTAYGGSRSRTAAHMQVARDHGFTDIATVDILDADGSMELDVPKGVHLTKNLVGSHYENYDGILVLSHFKGHAMAGFGGAIKNISIGFASSEGKAWIHSGGTSSTNIWGGNQDDFLEAMGEAALSVQTDKGSQIVYINVMNHLSVDCDCDSSPATPTMNDIGILASTDPVALDQACIDLVYAASDSRDLINRIESRNGLHTLNYASSIGLGSQKYNLVSIDD